MGEISTRDADPRSGHENGPENRPRTIPQAVDRSLAVWGEHPVVMELSPSAEPRSVSAADFRSRISWLSAWLESEGISEGTRVVLFLENSIEYVVLLLSLFEIRALPFIGKPEYRKLELDEIFENADPQVVVAEASQLELLGPYFGERHVIARDGAGFRSEQRGRGAAARVASAADEAAPTDAGSTATDPELPAGAASVNYTYRGYGYPLGVVVTHAQYLHGASVLQDGLCGMEGEKMLFSIPLTHIFTLVGCMLVPLLYGMTAVVARTIHPRVIFEYFDTYDIQHVTAVPEIYRLLHRARPKERTFPSLRTFVSGGSLLGKDEYASIRDGFDIELLHGYGLTEFTPATRNIRGRARAGTIGPVCGKVECRIEADGEILLRTDSMGRRYYRRSRETREAYVDGWLCTGDIGRFSGGHLVFEREKKRTCKVGGILVDLEEVKRALELDPEVARARVTFEDGAITAGLEIPHSVDLAEKKGQLRDFLKPLIAAYKVPRRFHRL
ncbi:MAG: class I adenylate-forming enzyme family protein [Spirochaetota bacterium]